MSVRELDSNRAQWRGLLHGLCMLLCALGGVRTGAAEPVRLGAGSRALPGFFRVPVVAAAPRGMLLAGGVGYGFTESQVEASGAHHRVRGRLSGALTPLKWLDLSARTDLKYDRHSAADDLGADSGTAIDSELYAQAGTVLGPDFHLGAGLGATFVRGVSVLESLASPAIDLQALGAYVPRHSAFSVGALAGFRYDRSADAMLAPAAYRSGDRLALGVSELDAVPLGIGGNYRRGGTELVLELSGDILVGADAPALGESPWRGSAGARQRLSDALALSVMTETALSARPRTGPTDPLLPVEPRFQVVIGVAYDLFDWEARAIEPVVAPVLTRPAPTPATAEVASAALVHSLRVNVTTAQGYPLSDATVELVAGEDVVGVPHEALETYRVGGLAAGEPTLRVSAPRSKPHTQQIQLRGGSPLVIDVQLEDAPSIGQVRGLVRSFGGQGLRAQIRIEPIGSELTTDVEGTFSVDAPPGRYEVVIEAPGHQRQRRQVEVRPDGVVILNADLRRIRQ